MCLNVAQRQPNRGVQIISALLPAQFAQKIFQLCEPIGKGFGLQRARKNFFTRRTARQQTPIKFRNEVSRSKVLISAANSLPEKINLRGRRKFSAGKVTVRQEFSSALTENHWLNFLSPAAFLQVFKLISAKAYRKFSRSSQFFGTIIIAATA